jgi:glucokinase
VGEAVAIGIDIGGTKLVAAVLDGQGRVLERLRRQTPAGDAERLLEDLHGLIDDLGADREGGLGSGLPVGIGIAGLVTPAGMVRYGPNIDVHDLDLARLLAERTSQPALVLNDASAAALGEQRVGAARGHRDVVMLTLGTGIGGGVVVGGRLLTGANGFGGELGHLLVDDGGRPCPCGNHGCIEAYASGTAIGRRARQRLADEPVDSLLREVEGITGRDVTLAARDGDELASEVLVEAGEWLGVALAGLVNALDPEVVLLGGGAAAQTATWILPAARDAMAERIIGHAWRSPPPVELAALGDDAGMVGAGLAAADLLLGEQDAP